MKKKNKKKIILIVCASIVSVLLLCVLGAYIWYVNSPLPTAMNMMEAIENKDMDAMLDCIEPEKSNMIRGLLEYFDIDIETMMDRFMPDGTLSSKEDMSNIKFEGYHRDGDKAYFEIGTLDSESGESTTRKINFVRIDGKWYFALEF